MSAPKLISVRLTTEDNEAVLLKGEDARLKLIPTVADALELSSSELGALNEGEELSLPVKCKSYALFKVLEYLDNYKHGFPTDSVLNDWDRTFFKRTGPLFSHLVLAAQNLEIDYLTNATCQYVIEILKDVKDPLEVYAAMNGER